MAFTRLAYPAVLTKTNWDKNKGVIGIKLEAMKKAALAEVNGDAAKLRAAAFAARDAARKVSGDLKKNPLTKSAGTVCDQIEKAADFMGVGANSNSLGGYIEKDVDEAKNAFDVTAKAIKTRIPSTVTALKNAIKAPGDPTTPKQWKAAAMMTKCRDLNQLICAQADGDGLRPRHGYRQGQDLLREHADLRLEGVPVRGE